MCKNNVRNVFESAVQVKINLIFQRKTLRNHSMMQSLVLMTERNPDGTTPPYPSLSPDLHHLPQLSLAPTATLIDNEPKGAAIITASRLATSPGFNSSFSGFIRPHLPGGESGICLPLPSPSSPSACWGLCVGAY